MSDQTTPAAAMLTVDTTRVIHTMATGAGASWHALGPDVFWYPQLHNRVNRSARGSGFGGNPPLHFSDAWKDLLGHAGWLGLSLMRVEFDLRMFAPERGRFDWDNPEMQTLYRILDYCQQNRVDVFLTHMWQDVEWNAHGGVGRLQSAPKSIPDFADAITALMRRLLHDRRYSCIRWLCIANEPGFPACWWMGPGDVPADMMPTLHALRRSLDQSDINISLSGPDWCDPAQNSAEFDLNDAVLGAFDVHNYRETAALDVLKTWADRAHARGIPFIQSEAGSWNGDNPFVNPTAESPRWYRNQLLNAEKMLGGFNLGVDGFNRWNFVNRGDLDGQWQLVRTWDATRWEYFPRVTPEPVPYYAYGILTRFLSKRSDVLSVQGHLPSVLACAVRSPGGNITLYLLNQSDSSVPLSLSFRGSSAAHVFYKYQVTEPAIQSPDYQMNPLAQRKLESGAVHSDTLPPASVTVYSTFHLPHASPGVILDD